MIAFSHCGRLEVGDVAAAARLGDAERDDLLAREHRRRNALLELLRSERENRRQADAMRHQRCAEPARADRGQLLGDDEAVEIVEALAVPAILLGRSEEHTSELQSLMRISYAVFCLKKKNNTK